MAANDRLENRPFDQIEIGESASISRTLTSEDISLFATVSGDVNPTHFDAAFMRAGAAHGVIGHAMWAGSLISNALGTKLPGPGTTYLSQDLQFHGPIAVGDELTVTVTVKEKRPDDHGVVLDCLCVNQDGTQLVTGTAQVKAPTEKVSLEPTELPSVALRRHKNYERLIDTCNDIDAIPTAVAHPCDKSSLTGAVEAAEAGLIVPTLVGPEARIRGVADKEGLDISPYTLIDAAHSHEAAARAVEVVRGGKAELLMKGSLHTDELLSEVMKRETGLRTERRISHCFIMDVPTYPEPLVITDAAINIYPTLEDKIHIVQNAIDMAVALSGETPRVAILSAVETVNPKIPSTLEAAALCKMADRGQITGGLLDGPLALDNAISVEAARIKGIDSPVAGKANILIVPDLEAGNMLAKNLSFLANSDAAGIVLGARVPIILTSRADSVRTRMASCAVAVLYADSLRSKTKLAAE